VGPYAVALRWGPVVDLYAYPPFAWAVCMDRGPQCFEDGLEGARVFGIGGVEIAVVATHVVQGA